MTCIVFTRTDGRLCVMVPAAYDADMDIIAAQDVPVVLDESMGDYPAGTEMDRRAADALGAKYTQLTYSIISEVNVPSDRTFRNAWNLQGDAIAHDMSKAKEMQRERLRQARPAVFAKLDELYMRADETGNVAAKAAIVLRKKALRDAPADPRIDAAATVEALKLIVLPET